MEYEGWNEDNWSALLYAIQQQDCILMLGPDAAIAQVGEQPLLTMLANELAEKLQPHIASWNIDYSNLAQVAQYYRMKIGKNELGAKVVEFFNAKHSLTSELHRNLAELPLYLTITSTPDRLLYNALKNADKDPKIEGYHFKGKQQSMVQMGTVEAPLLFYLYGTIKESKSLVLTEDDLLDFLVAVIQQNPPLPDNILSELKDENKSFLFLGFGFKHWYLRILLRVLQISSKESRSFALEQFIPQNMDESAFRDTVLFYRESKYKIHIYHQELHSFVKELRERYQERAAPSASSTAPPKISLQDAPKVFLCHSKQNRDDAEYLRNRLMEAGFNAWFDEDDLRGGDEWDRKIERAIKEEIDYFVVLQSQVMTTKIESYFNKEIDLALERQRYFRPGIRFIIPIKIEDCPLVEELDHLQTIDLSDKVNIEQLISTLKRDQQRRKRE